SQERSRRRRPSERRSRRTVTTSRPTVGIWCVTSRTAIATSGACGTTFATGTRNAVISTATSATERLTAETSTTTGPPVAARTPRGRGETIPSAGHAPGRARAPVQRADRLLILVPGEVPIQPDPGRAG